VKRSLLVVSAFALVGLLSSTALQAEIIKAGNAVLAKKGSRVYIPQTDGCSGILGLPVTGNIRQKVGYQIESSRLNPDQVVQGYVAMELDFGGVKQYMDSDAATLLLTVNDIDFKPQAVGSAMLREWITFSFVSDKGTVIDVTAVPDLVLNEANYGDYRADGFGATNNKKVTYSIPLSALGADFDNINADHEFAIVMTLYSSMTRAHTGSAGPYWNTTEAFNAQVAYDLQKGPEPATMALLLAGVGMVLRRRR